MSAALAPPLIVASLLLCVAGALKLRSPVGAVGALAALGLPARAWIVRAVAVFEIALGAVCAVDPSRVAVVALAGVYALFAAVAAILMRRRVACGCFGENDFPASSGHWIASGLLASLALAAAALGPPHGLGWLLSRSTATGAIALVGIAGALYAVVVVYTVVPRAWGAWGSE
jgi:hypothetical protein